MMKRIIVLFTAVFMLLSFSMQAQAWRHNEMEVRVKIPDQQTARTIAGLKLNGDYAAGYAILYITPAEAEMLDRAGIDYEIQIYDLNLHYKDFWESKTAYHSYQEIVDLADSLVSAFPDICMKVMYGTSIQGRELAALKISDNVGVNENEAEVFFDGGIHGDETVRYGSIIW